MKTKKAAGLTAAGEKKLRNESYPKPAPQSSLKTLIGEILLFGNKQRKEFWQIFEVLLTQHVQSLTEYASERPRRARIDQLR